MTKLNINESQYLNLKAGAPYRLFILKSAAAYTTAPDVNLPPSMQYASWSDARRTTFITLETGLCAGFNTKYAGSQYEERMPIWSTFGESPFRNEQFVDELDSVNIDHRGWFTDADCSQTLRGVVAGVSRGRFVAGYVSNETGERVYFAKVFDCEKDAAHFADHEAQSLAEEEQEYSQRWREASDLSENIESERVEIGRLFALRNHPRFGGADLRDELRDHITETRRMIAELANDFSDIEI